MLDRYKVKYYHKLIRTFFRKRYKSSEVTRMPKKSEIKEIAVLYSIPKSSPRFDTWNDGFVDAIKSIDYNITWINIEIDNVSEELLNSFDFLLVKSNWNWGPDKLLRDKYRNLKVKRGLAVAGVSIPPKFPEMMYYNVLWYETDWYRKIILNHPNIFHGFGINKRALHPTKQKPIIYDYISIGAFLPHKRMERLLKLNGKILVIGEKYETDYSKQIYNLLKAKNNIEILPYVEYEKLPDYFNLAKTLYITASVNGGGERAILEAKHCGLKVIVEKDNPKLKEVVNSPIWDSKYYAEQLMKGINSI